MTPFPRVRIRLLPVLMLAFLASAGCTHAQLRRSTVVHSMTLSEIYTQQVLNNLAMFVQNPDALPFFAFPNQGTTQIQDMGGIGGPGNTSSSFVTSPLNLNASRQATENWVLVPVSDPAKLALMRCAYQKAIASCIPTRSIAKSDCPDCNGLRDDFYGPAVPEPGKLNAGDDPACLNSPPWFTWGCQKHAHSAGRHSCQLVGSYCNVYVCVPPEGRDMLTRLTLAILDYAVNDPEQYVKRLKQVEVYLDEDGDLTTQELAVTKISATIPIDEKSLTLAVVDKQGLTMWADFLKQFKKEDADKLVAELIAGSVANDKLKKDRNAVWTEQDAKAARLKAEKYARDPVFWTGIDTGKYTNSKVAGFFKENAEKYGMLPQDVPGPELINAKSSFEKKGSASTGVQQLLQRLNAAGPK